MRSLAKKDGQAGLAGFLDSRSPQVRVASLRVFDNLALLNLMTRTTPQVIFPYHMIGELRDVYETTLLALDRNPLETLNERGGFELPGKIKTSADFGVA